jgi:hypothetical protein
VPFEFHGIHVQPVTHRSRVGAFIVHVYTDLALYACIAVVI